jgi:hypothetical protein
MMRWRRRVLNNLHFQEMVRKMYGVAEYQDRMETVGGSALRDGMFLSALAVGRRCVQTAGTSAADRG